jgi:methyl-accepting chemotaxis protein
MAGDLVEALSSMRKLIEEIRQASITLGSSSEELIAITKEFSAGIEIQVVKATQIASATEEVAKLGIELKSAVEKFKHLGGENAGFICIRLYQKSCGRSYRYLSN